MKTTLNLLKQHVDFNDPSDEPAQRFTRSSMVIGVTEWRKKIAHGVSRGLQKLRFSSPGGASEGLFRATTIILSRLRAWRRFASLTHGLRRWLLSVAASRLDPAAVAAAVWIMFSPWLSLEAAELKTQNVFLIMSDGLRWQEVFNGAEEILMTQTNGGVKNVEAFRKEFWRETPEERRKALLPFFWNDIAQHGQLYGNQNKGSVVRLTNGKKFSYPGYNEVFTGFGDPRIDSNKKIPNPNVTIFEWLQQKSQFRKRVVAFGGWDVFPYLLNRERSGLPVWPAWEAKFDDKIFSPPPMIVKLMGDTTPIWEDVILDSLLYEAAIEHVKARRPRVMFLGFCETDEWAHSGRYDLYLHAAHHVDRFIKTLWDTVQAMPQYRGKTTFIITADHGRGHGPSEWKDHGEKIAGAEGIWIAVLGPDTPSLGERTNTAPLTQAQIAATVAAFLGENFCAAFPKAAPPVAEAISKVSR